jgi:hypothetical protein
MIDELAAAVSTRLRARGWPAIVSYGPPRLERMMPQPGAIEVELSDAADTYGPSIGTKAPATRGDMTCSSSADVEVRVASTLAGAGHTDHRRLARAVVSDILIEARSWLASKNCIFRGARGEFTSPIDTPQEFGAVYTLSLDFDRGIVATPKSELDGFIVDGADQAYATSGTTTVNGGNVCSPPAPGD